MPKNKKKPIHVYCPVFRRNIWAFYKWTAQELNDYIFKTFNQKFDGLEDLNGCVRILENKEKRDTIIILWVRKSHKNEELACLTHESIHASNIIIRESGHKICPDNDELQAYHTTMIVRGVLNCSK
jgi:hypothetical protein